jgi:hypothetical protein
MSNDITNATQQSNHADHVVNFGDFSQGNYNGADISAGGGLFGGGNDITNATQQSNHADHVVNFGDFSQTNYNLADIDVSHFWH